MLIPEGAAPGGVQWSDLASKLQSDWSQIGVNVNIKQVSFAELLQAYKFGCLPVVERGKLVGIVTEADFVGFARRYFEWEMEAQRR